MVSTHPLLIAHRGASASAQGNTLAAFVLAVAQDADGVEIDVRRTADGHLVLHHDPLVPGIGAIIGVDLSTLRRRAPHIPTLDEMLDVTGDLLIDVEIKNDPGEPDHDPNHGVADAVAAWVAARDLRQRVMVSSFNPGTTSRILALDPSITTGQLLDGGVDMDLMGAAAAVAEAGHHWVLPADRLLGNDPGPVIDAVHATRLRIGVWTVNGADRLARLAAAGIDAIVTDDPGAALQALT